METVGSKPLIWISVLVFLYVFVAFLAPISMKYGYESIGKGIYELYERFCHQRVERSLFIFGKSSFYTVAQLQEYDYLPSTSDSNSYPIYFGHDYVGNEDIGYKVAICVRDIGLYLAFAISGILIGLKKRTSVPWKWVVILILPIFLDIGLQWIVEIFRIDTFLWFVNDLNKRWVTGILAGIGSSLGLFNLFKNGLTKSSQQGNI